MLDKLLPDYQSIHDEYHSLGVACCLNADPGKEDEATTFNKAAWAKAGLLTLHGLPVEHKFGGKSFSAMQTCAAFEGFGKGCNDNGLTFSIGAHSIACALPIQLYGSNHQKEMLLKPLAKGDKAGANGMTELESGSDVFAMQTTAVKDNNNYIINGCKAYVTNAPIADAILVYCATDNKKGFFGGISAFLIPTNTRGVTIDKYAKKMGLATCPMANVRLDKVVLTAENMIGSEGGGAMIFTTSMMWERVVLSAANLGQWQRVYEQTTVHCKIRKIKNTALINLPNIAHSLAEIKIMISAAKNLVYEAAYSIDGNAKDALQKASIAKCFVAEHAVRGIQKMQTIYGAAGYLAENEIEREYRDIYAALIYSGTTDIQKNIIIGHEK